MPAARVTEDEALRWRDAYEAGDTIESIALDTGRATNTVGAWLRRVGTTIRPKTRRPVPERATGKASLIKQVRFGDRRGHRRRGRAL